MPVTSSRKIMIFSHIFQNYTKLLFPAIFPEKIFVYFFDITARSRCLVSGYSILFMKKIKTTYFVATAS